MLAYLLREREREREILTETCSESATAGQRQEGWSDPESIPMEDCSQVRSIVPVADELCASEALPDHRDRTSLLDEQRETRSKQGISSYDPSLPEEERYKVNCIWKDAGDETVHQQLSLQVCSEVQELTKCKQQHNCPASLGKSSPQEAHLVSNAYGSTVPLASPRGGQKKNCKNLVVLPPSSPLQSPGPLSSPVTAPLRSPNIRKLLVKSPLSSPKTICSHTLSISVASDVVSEAKKVTSCFMEVSGSTQPSDVSDTSKLHTTQDKGQSGVGAKSRPELVVNIDVAIDIEGKREKVCRVCYMPVGNQRDEGEALELGCTCKDELALAHRRCAEAWFKIRGNRTCEICGTTVENIAISSTIDDPGFLRRWKERRIVRPEPVARRWWNRQPICNVVIVSMVVACLLPWLIHAHVFF